MDPSRVHYVTITGIIRKGDRYLIAKRSSNEKAFPGRWCVPGGKIEHQDFIDTAKGTKDHWLDIFEKVLHKEIKEETGLEIHDIGYVSSLVFLRPNGFSTIIVSMHAEHKGGDVMLDKDELTDYAWVTLEEAKGYDLIDNIYEQIERVERLKKGETK